jgi:hypothetical protein
MYPSFSQNRLIQLVVSGQQDMPRPQTATGNQSAGRKQKRVMQHEAGVRKNSRLHYMLPPDVLMLKGEVLRSAISHHEVDSLKHLNRLKRDMYDMYSIKKTPSIQAVRWKPEHNGLVMSGFQLGSSDQTYGQSLKSPPDRYLKRAETAHQFQASIDHLEHRVMPIVDEVEVTETKLKIREEQHKKALQQVGVEV